MIINGGRDVKNSWSGNNRCHKSQENVITLWTALHPSFPDSYSVWSFPEQGWKQFARGAPIESPSIQHTLRK